MGESKVIRIDGVSIDLLNEYKDLLLKRYSMPDEMLDKMTDSVLITMALKDAVYYEKNLLESID